MSAHPARGITTDGHPDLLVSSHVEGVIDELSGTLPPEPPQLGKVFKHLDFHSLPDWGVIKLNDTSLQYRDNVHQWSNDPAEVYPYYHVFPNPTQDWGTDDGEFRPSYYDPLASSAPEGGDPFADRYWNYPSTDLAAGAGTFSGGPGWVYSGAYTDPIDGTLQRSLFLNPQIKVGPGLNTLWPMVTLSGALYPADRGVLSLLYFPPEGTDSVNFLAQPLLTRCVAALLLGQGLAGDPCMTLESVGAGGQGSPCDGGPGGIFAVGEDSEGYYDPFAFPGRATGQYNLDEIHEGLNIDGVTLPVPWDDYNLSGTAGAKRQINSHITAAGQVRLGSDADAGIAVVPWGIPVLGATNNAYDETAGALDTIIYPSGAGVPVTIKYVGHSVVQDPNFFQYRLPYLSDYSEETGLRDTPKGLDPSATMEAKRFFDPHTYHDLPVSGEPYQWSGGTFTMTRAGNYPDFGHDYNPWQLSRYRHTFFMSGKSLVSAPVPATPFEIGTYMLVHFKTEKDFEEMVRDGDVPVSVYGASLVPGTGPDDPQNIVNKLLAASGSTPPYGPAPAYGYSAPPEHRIHTKGFLVDSTDQEVVDGDFTVEGFGWEALGAGTGKVAISGITYMTPLDLAGASSFRITDLDVQIADAWNGVYRSNDQTRVLGSAPALINAPNPAFLGVAPFSYGSTPTFTTPLGFTDAWGKREHRIEFPYNYLGSFSEAVGPTAADSLDMALGVGNEITFSGDETTPSFSTDAALWCFVRRPIGHSFWETTVSPRPRLIGGLQQGHGVKLTSAFSTVGAAHVGWKILYHSTSWNTGAATASYGNYVDGANVAYASLLTANKDKEEKFLDEIYRYLSPWGAGLPAGVQNHLVGPGMNGWASAPIEVPVRAGSAVAPWVTSSWVQSLSHVKLLTGGTVTDELQVAGLPERNPTIQSWVNVPFPSAGLLRYPAVDYTTGYEPSALQAVFQPDYSTATGIRTWNRAFDASFSRSTVGTNGFAPVKAAGQPFVTFRLDGIKLEDFSFTAPGPGGLGNQKYAIMCKVPGLTSWMDIGRRDGAGPSKLDPALDGAGCQVVGAYTFEALDTETGYWYCQVKVNVGPTVNLFESTNEEVPILVKVIMDEVPDGEYDLTQQMTTGSWTTLFGPGLDPDDVRGLMGVKVAHTTEIITKPTQDTTLQTSFITAIPGGLSK